jgi:hypothetical protein
MAMGTRVRDSELRSEMEAYEHSEGTVAKKGL